MPQAITISTGLDYSAALRDIDRLGQIIASKDIKAKLNARGFTEPLGRITGSATEFNKSLDAANARVLAFSVSAGLLFKFKAGLEAIVQSAIDVEKTLTDINVVLNLNTQQLSKFGQDLFKIANLTGKSFKDVAAAALELSRQGLGVGETLKRTNDALILTRLSGLDAASSVEALTAAINGFDKSALQSTDIINKLASVDASFAVSSRDLAEALKRVGSIAQDAGVDFDELLAVVTAVQQTTARGGAVIGNALKSIFTRISRRDTIQDLQQLGVSIDESQSGIEKLRALAQALNDLGQANPGVANKIKELAGGVFQINIVSAALNDLNKQFSVYDSALRTANNATDEAISRNQRLNQTLSAFANETLNNIIEKSATVGQISFEPVIRRVLGLVNTLTGFVPDKDSEDIGSSIGRGILRGIGNFLEGPGLAVATAILGRLIFNFASFTKDALKVFLDFNNAAAQSVKIQQVLTGILASNPQFYKEIISANLTREQQETRIIQLLREELALLQGIKTTAASVTPRAIQAGFAFSPKTGLTLNPKTKAEGHVPESKPRGFIPEREKPRYGNITPARQFPTTQIKAAAGIIPQIKEIQGAYEGGYVPGEIRETRIKGLGPVIYNTAEKIKDFGLEQPAIMPPVYSEAGQKYKEKFKEIYNVNPYTAAGGIVPREINFPVFGKGREQEPIFSFNRSPLKRGDYIAFLKNVKGLSTVEAQRQAEKIYGYGQEYSRGLVPNYVKFLHGTSLANIPKIQKQGILPNKTKEKTFAGVFYKDERGAGVYVSRQTLDNTIVAPSKRDLVHRASAISRADLDKSQQAMVVLDIPQNYIDKFGKSDLEAIGGENSFIFPKIPKQFIKKILVKGDYGFEKYAADGLIPNYNKTIPNFEKTRKRKFYHGVKPQNRQGFRVTKDEGLIPNYANPFLQFKDIRQNIEKFKGFGYRAPFIQGEPLNERIFSTLLKRELDVQIDDISSSNILFNKKTGKNTLVDIGGISLPPGEGTRVTEQRENLPAKILKYDDFFKHGKYIGEGGEHIVHRFDKSVLAMQKPFFGGDDLDLLNNAGRQVLNSRFLRKILKQSGYGKEIGFDVVPSQLVAFKNKGNIPNFAETFGFGPVRYNIDEILKAIQNKKLKPELKKINIKEYAEKVLNLNRERDSLEKAEEIRGGFLVGINGQHSKNITEEKLKQPGVLTDLTLGRGKAKETFSLVIDGNHRIARAYLEGKDELPINYLSEEITKKFPYRFAEGLTPQKQKIFPGGLIPNYAKVFKKFIGSGDYGKLLGSGVYGDFYDLEKKFKGVNIGKKIVKNKGTETYNNIINEFRAAKYISNLDLGNLVTAPKVIGNLKRSIEAKRIGKEVVPGKTLKEILVTPEYDYNETEGYSGNVNRIVNKLLGYTKSKLREKRVIPSDLHWSNVVVNNKVEKFARNLIKKPQNIEKLFESSRFSNILENLGRTGGKISVVDPGDFVVPNYNRGLIPNYNFSNLLKDLNSKKSGLGRYLYAQKRFPPLGKGGSRTAFDIGDEAILKLPNPSLKSNIYRRGFAQNVAENNALLQQEGKPFIASVLQGSPFGKYLISEKANPVNLTKTQFREKSGLPFDTFRHGLETLRKRSYGEEVDEYDLGELEILKQNKQASRAADFIRNFELGLGDIILPHYGIVKNKEFPALVDYGYNEKVARKYYGHEGGGFSKGLIPNYTNNEIPQNEKELGDLLKNLGGPIVFGGVVRQKAKAFVRKVPVLKDFYDKDWIAEKLIAKIVAKETFGRESAYDAKTQKIVNERLRDAGISESLFDVLTDGLTNEINPKELKQRIKLGEFPRGLIPNYNQKLIPNYNKIIPNYNEFIGYSSPLAAAVEREKAAGVPESLIQISQSPRLKGNENPLGLAVINKRDEPRGINEGINRYVKDGLDPKKAGITSASGTIPIPSRKPKLFSNPFSSGLIPNFAYDFRQQFALDQTEIAGYGDVIKEKQLTPLSYGSESFIFNNKSGKSVVKFPLSYGSYTERNYRNKAIRANSGNKLFKALNAPFFSPRARKVNLGPKSTLYNLQSPPALIQRKVKGKTLLKFFEDIGESKRTQEYLKDIETKFPVEKINSTTENLNLKARPYLDITGQNFIIPEQHEKEITEIIKNFRPNQFIDELRKRNLKLGAIDLNSGLIPNFAIPKNHIEVFRGMSQEAYNKFKKTGIIAPGKFNKVTTNLDTAKFFASQFDDPGKVIKMVVPKHSLIEDEIYTGDFKVRKRLKPYSFEDILNRGLVPNFNLSFGTLKRAVKQFKQNKSNKIIRQDSYQPYSEKHYPFEIGKGDINIPKNTSSEIILHEIGHIFSEANFSVPDVYREQLANTTALEIIGKRNIKDQEKYKKFATEQIKNYKIGEFLGNLRFMKDELSIPEYESKLKISNINEVRTPSDIKKQNRIRSENLRTIIKDFGPKQTINYIKGRKKDDVFYRQTLGAAPFLNKGSIPNFAFNYPLIQKNVKSIDGRLIREKIPNLSSISSSFNDYEILPGIREVPMEYFTNKYTNYSVSEHNRTEKLKEAIANSKEINPLIVAVDKEGPYILEGGHRFNALGRLGAKSFPAKVVFDLDDTTLEELQKDNKFARGKIPNYALPASIGEPVSPILSRAIKFINRKYPRITSLVNKMAVFKSGAMPSEDFGASGERMVSRAAYSQDPITKQNILQINADASGGSNVRSEDIGHELYHLIRRVRKNKGSSNYSNYDEYFNDPEEIGARRIGLNVKSKYNTDKLIQKEEISTLSNRQLARVARLKISNLSVYGTKNNPWFEIHGGNSGIEKIHRDFDPHISLTDRKKTIIREYLEKSVLNRWMGDKGSPKSRGSIPNYARLGNFQFIDPARIRGQEATDISLGNILENKDFGPRLQKLSQGQKIEFAFDSRLRESTHANFQSGRDPEIKLNRNYFLDYIKRLNYGEKIIPINQAITKTLAHEFGHKIDYRGFETKERERFSKLPKFQKAFLKDREKYGAFLNELSGVSRDANPFHESFAELIGSYTAQRPFFYNYLTKPEHSEIPIRTKKPIDFEDLESFQLLKQQGILNFDKGLVPNYGSKLIPNYVIRPQFNDLVRYNLKNLPPHLLPQLEQLYGQTAKIRTIDRYPEHPGKSLRALIETHPYLEQSLIQLLGEGFKVDPKNVIYAEADRLNKEIRGLRQVFPRYPQETNNRGASEINLAIFFDKLQHQLQKNAVLATAYETEAQSRISGKLGNNPERLSLKEFREKNPILKRSKGLIPNFVALKGPGVPIPRFNIDAGFKGMLTFKTPRISAEREKDYIDFLTRYKGLTHEQAEKYIDKLNKTIFKETSKGHLYENTGLIPNFNKFIGYNNPLSQAVEREKAAGVPESLIRISQSARLKSSENPLGLAVINRRDEPAGINEGINRYAAMGLNPKIAGIASQKSGIYNKGAIPNFAPILESSDLRFGTKVLETAILPKFNELSTALSNLTLDYKQAIPVIDSFTKEFSLTTKSAESLKTALLTIANQTKVAAGGPAKTALQTAQTRYPAPTPFVPPTPPTNLQRIFAQTRFAKTPLQIPQFATARPSGSIINLPKSISQTTASTISQISIKRALSGNIDKLKAFERISKEISDVEDLINKSVGKSSDASINALKTTRLKLKAQYNQLAKEISKPLIESTPQEAILTQLRKKQLQRTGQLPPPQFIPPASPQDVQQAFFNRPAQVTAQQQANLRTPKIEKKLADDKILNSLLGLTPNRPFTTRESEERNRQLDDLLNGPAIFHPDDLADRKRQAERQVKTERIKNLVFGPQKPTREERRALLNAQTPEERTARRNARLQNIGIGLTFGGSTLGGITQEFIGRETKESRVAGATAGALGNVASFAGIGASFGPGGFVGGALVGGALGVGAVLKELNTNLPELQTELERIRESAGKSVDAISSYIKITEALTDNQNKFTSASQKRLEAERLSLLGLLEPGDRRRLKEATATGRPADLADILSSVQRRESQRVLLSETLVRTRTAFENEPRQNQLNKTNFGAGNNLNRLIDSFAFGNPFQSVEKVTKRITEDQTRTAIDLEQLILSISGREGETFQSFLTKPENNKFVEKIGQSGGNFEDLRRVLSEIAENIGVSAKQRGEIFNRTLSSENVTGAVQGQLSNILRLDFSKGTLKQQKEFADKDLENRNNINKGLSDFDDIIARTITSFAEFQQFLESSVEENAQIQRGILEIGIILRANKRQLAEPLQTPEQRIGGEFTNALQDIEAKQKSATINVTGKFAANFQTIIGKAAPDLLTGFEDALKQGKGTGILSPKDFQDRVKKFGNLITERFTLPSLTPEGARAQLGNLEDLLADFEKLRSGFKGGGRGLASLKEFEDLAKKQGINVKARETDVFKNIAAQNIFKNREIVGLVKTEDEADATVERLRNVVSLLKTLQQAEAAALRGVDIESKQEKEKAEAQRKFQEAQRAVELSVPLQTLGRQVTLEEDLKKARVQLDSLRKSGGAFNDEIIQLSETVENLAAKTSKVDFTRLLKSTINVNEALQKTTEGINLLLLRVQEIGRLRIENLEAQADISEIRRRGQVEFETPRLFREQRIQRGFDVDIGTIEERRRINLEKIGEQTRFGTAKALTSDIEGFLSNINKALSAEPTSIEDREKRFQEIRAFTDIAFTRQAKSEQIEKLTPAQIENLIGEFGKRRDDLQTQLRAGDVTDITFRTPAQAQLAADLFTNIITQLRSVLEQREFGVKGVEQQTGNEQKKAVESRRVQELLLKNQISVPERLGERQTFLKESLRDANTELETLKQSGSAFSDEIAEASARVQELGIRLGKINDKNIITESFKGFREELTFGDKDTLKSILAGYRDTARDLKADFKDAFKSFADGSKSAGEAFNDFITGIARKIQNRAIDLAVDQLFGAIFGSQSNSVLGAIGKAFGSGTGKARGGLIKKYAVGGKVMGGSGFRDDVPALLNNGEYVIKKASVNKYGETFFNNLNTGQIPRYNSGNYVKRYTSGDFVRNYASGDFVDRLPEQPFPRSQNTFIPRTARFGTASFPTTDTVRSNLKNLFTYDDEKRPTSGKLEVDPKLSSFALQDENNPQNAIRLEREDALFRYLQDKKQYEADKAKAIKQFKRGKQNALIAAYISAAVSIGAGAIGGKGTGTTTGTARTNVTGLQYRGSGRANYGGIATGGLIRTYETGGIIANTGSLPKTIDIPNAPKFPVKNYLNFAYGGSTETDKVPALLTGGEFVMSRNAVNRYGVKTFDQLNAGVVPRYQTGGYVGDRNTNTNRDFTPNFNTNTSSQPLIDSLTKLIEINQDIRASLENNTNTAAPATQNPNNNQNSQGLVINFSQNITIEKSGSVRENNSQNTVGGNQDKEQDNPENIKKFQESMRNVVIAEIVKQQRIGGLLANTR